MLCLLHEKHTKNNTKKILGRVFCLGLLQSAVNPPQKFKLARQAQPHKITAEYLANRLGVSESAIREMELGRNKSLLKKAAQIFGPEWGLTEEWFYDGKPPLAVAETRQEYTRDVVDLPAFVGQSFDNSCTWDLTGQKQRHPVRHYLVTKEMSTYSVLIVDGSQWAPRITHGSAVLVHRTRVVPDRALCLAEINKVPTIAVFSTDGKIDSVFPTATPRDTILGVVEFIHHRTKGSANLEFYDGDPVTL